MIKFWQALLQGRFLGHPIHAMLVHFPSAFFPAALLFDLISYFVNDALYSRIGFYMLGLGVITGIAAACFGAIDYFKLAPQHKAWKKASFHACLNILWLMIFGTLWGLNMMNYPEIKIISLAQLITMAFTVLGLLISNFLGGELVYHHNVGLIAKHDDSKH